MHVTYLKLAKPYPMVGGCVTPHLVEMENLLYVLSYVLL